MGLVEKTSLTPMTQDVDDYRPGSRWGFAVDPDHLVASGVIYELIGVGDAIPLHRHAVDEVVLVLEGTGEMTLADSVRRVDGGATAFIAAGTVHGIRNTGTAEIRYVAVFPSTNVVDMEMLARIPAPGTEDRKPRHTEWNMQTGEVRVLP